MDCGLVKNKVVNRSWVENYNSQCLGLINDDDAFGCALHLTWLNRLAIGSCLHSCAFGTLFASICLRYENCV